MPVKNGSSIFFRRRNRATVKISLSTLELQSRSQEDYKDWRRIKGIQLEGTGLLVDSTLEKTKAMAVYARKYPEVIKLFTTPGSGVFYQAFLKVKFYCVVPEKLYFIDNEQGFGKRQELEFREQA
jgi:hypothetical protein